METEGRGNIEFGVANPESDEIVLRRRKHLEARRHLLLLEEQIQDLHLVLKRFSKKNRSQKCQYSVKQRLAVLSGIRVMYQKYCQTLVEELSRVQNSRRDGY